MGVGVEGDIIKEGVEEVVVAEVVVVVVVAKSKEEEGEVVGEEVVVVEVGQEEREETITTNLNREMIRDGLLPSMRVARTPLRIKRTRNDSPCPSIAVIAVVVPCMK